MSTWMVVEDEPEIYELLLAMFEMWGIEGVAFVDGEEAIAWIEDVDNSRFQGELPELALLDIRLPGEINGIEVGERLRKSPILGNMALVMTTAFKLNDDEQKKAMEQSGADYWMPKPLPKFEELQKKLEQIIADRRAKNEALGIDTSNATLGKKPDEVKKLNEIKKLDEVKTKTSETKQDDQA